GRCYSCRHVQDCNTTLTQINHAQYRFHIIQTFYKHTHRGWRKSGFESTVLMIFVRSFFYIAVFIRTMPFESNDTFKQIFQSSVEAIIMADRDGKILLANPMSERMFGYDQGELIGKTIEDLLPEELRKKHIAYRKEFNRN